MKIYVHIRTYRSRLLSEALANDGEPSLLDSLRSHDIALPKKTQDPKSIQEKKKEGNEEMSYRYRIHLFAAKTHPSESPSAGHLILHCTVIGFWGSSAPKPSSQT